MFRTDVRPQLDPMVRKRNTSTRTTLAHINTVNALREAYECLDKVQADISLLKNSRSFKIGRYVTFPLRFLRHGRRARQAPDLGCIAEAPRMEFPISVGIDLDNQIEECFGVHRSGWSYVISALSKLQNSGAIYLDTFIERTYGWKLGESKKGPRPWIGIIHVPPNVPDWFHHELSNARIFATEEWAEHQPYCRGLYTLSEYHRKELQKTVDIPISSLLHPTEFIDNMWSWEAFKRNRHKKLVQVGWWLRKLNAIFELPQSSYKKVLLLANEDKATDLMDHERRLHRTAGIFNDSMLSTVEVARYLENVEYDTLLSQNVVFVDLYDSSANNTIIECIARCTPLLINPLPAVEEYLGDEYPLYYRSYSEAIEKAEDLDLIRYAHEYLRSFPIRKKLTSDYFIESFLNSEIYQSYCGSA